MRLGSRRVAPGPAAPRGYDQKPRLLCGTAFGTIREDSGWVKRCEKLVRKARGSPGGLRFAEACRLARCLGFEQVRRTAGSHRVFKKPGVRGLINLQDRDGRAIAYQVRQILSLAEELGLFDEEGGS